MGLIGLAACAPTNRAPTFEFTQLAPGLRIDPAARTVEYDGTVAVDTKNPDTPDVFLELIACTPDTREHESLVVSPVQPSLIHAALLAADFEPGAPGRIAVTTKGLERQPATGDRLTLELIWTDYRGREQSAAPHEWIRLESGELLDPFTWVFAGSRLVERRGTEVYDADGTGTVIGLTTFGAEVIAPTATVSPDSGTDTPMFLAENDAMPPAGTRVTVRLGPPK
ncbi:MAG: YdjY domain-containing protein [Planctomycetota bacterium]